MLWGGGDVAPWPLPLPVFSLFLLDSSQRVSWGQGTPGYPRYTNFLKKIVKMYLELLELLLELLLQLLLELLLELLLLLLLSWLPRAW